MSENLFAYTATNSGYSEGTAKTKNENLELGTCGINDPWFYREVRCESGAVTQLY